MLTPVAQNRQYDTLQNYTHAQTEAVLPGVMQQVVTKFGHRYAITTTHQP